MQLFSLLLFRLPAEDDKKSRGSPAGMRRRPSESPDHRSRRANMILSWSPAGSGRRGQTYRWPQEASVTGKSLKAAARDATIPSSKTAGLAADGIPGIRPGTTSRRILKETLIDSIRAARLRSDGFQPRAFLQCFIKKKEHHDDSDRSDQYPGSLCPGA